jgi:hypothetical protein
MIRGVVGSIRWAYHVAAAIRDYQVTRTGTAWALTGRVVSSDAFKLQQRPLTFVAPHKYGEWRWPIETLALVDGQVTAQLGPPERES